MMMNNKYFPESQIPFIRERLLAADDNRANLLHAVQFKRRHRTGHWQTGHMWWFWNLGYYRLVPDYEFNTREEFHTPHVYHLKDEH